MFWKKFLKNELYSENFQGIISALQKERDTYCIFPKDNYFITPPRQYEEQQQ